MGTVVVIGDQLAVQGWALAGVRVCPAADQDAVRAAWHSLGEDVALVLLTPAAARSLAAELSGLAWPLTVVIPT